MISMDDETRISILKEFVKKERHLPSFLKDFHNQKDVFKIVGGFKNVSRIDGHVYVIDRFLPVMSYFGFGLQKLRHDIEFLSIKDAIDEMKQAEARSLINIMKGNSNG